MPESSARNEYERIRDERRQRVSANGPALATIAGASTLAGAVAADAIFGAWWLGALLGVLPLVNLLAPSQREVAWRKGAHGELTVARTLDQLVVPARTLHDRRIPGSRGNIDHILIAPSGVWTIDAKNYTGKLETRARDTQLWINGRDRSKLLDQARRQRDVVARVLASNGLNTVPVRPALCFLGVEWPLLFRPSAAADVALTSPGQLRDLGAGSEVLSASQIVQATQVLDRALRPMVEDSASATRGVSSALAPTTSAPTPPPPVDRQTGALTVKPWNRYGKRRLYVNQGDGTTLGYVDLETNEVVPVDEDTRTAVQDAVAAYLRGS